MFVPFFFFSPLILLVIMEFSIIGLRIQLLNFDFELLGYEYNYDLRNIKDHVKLYKK